ncbi:SLC13 family permease [Sporosarcina sp. ACRSM]|uniref:SLC13 family permease n=1 Tax=Sporosarcina sp. ACRSM TaxID=2918216 RepID=UPI001EF3EECC|nr:SLC13 family permease [Sporosarcina sp. ACRSM]MCG7334555.1 SLC13 family permease [Sporosarcina sp. ACRSM]
MNMDMMLVLILIVSMLVCLIVEIARPGMIIFSVLVILLLAGILTPREALSGFSNEGMMTVALLFIVAGAVQKSGMTDYIVEKWLRKSQTETGAMVRFFVPISMLSAFLNNTPIVVTFTPTIKNWCEERGIAPSKFLIPLSYATILGGTITLMGTSTNIVVHGMLLDYGLDGFSLFTLSAVGIPVTVLGLFFLFTIGKRLLPDHKGFSQQVKEGAKEYIAEMNVGTNYPFVDQSVATAGLSNLEGLYLIEIIRESGRVSPVRNSTIIQAGDRLIFAGKISTMAELQKMNGLTLRTGTDLELDDLKNGSTHLVEAVVSHRSGLLSKSIKQSQFRARFDAGVIALHRNNERIQSKVSDILVKPGDTLLLLAGADFVEKYERSNDFYVVSRLETPDVLNRFSWKSWFSIALLVFMILFVSFGLFSMLEAMALAVILLIIAKIVNAEEIMKNMQFDVLLIIASSLGIGVAMTKTGLADMLASGLITVGEPFGIIGIIIIFYTLTNLFTEFITNSAAAVLMLPIGLELANTLHVDPMGFAILVTIAASASFLTPIGYQTNLIVYGPGGYTFFDYVRIGTPLSLLVMVTAITVIYTIWF